MSQQGMLLQTRRVKKKKRFTSMRNWIYRQMWYFVKFGATQQAHEIMLSFFFESIVTTAMCNTGVFMVSIPLFVAVAKGKTCLPKWACLVNTIPLTLAAAIVFAGMGAMNVGSALMVFGLYYMIRKS